MAKCPNCGNRVGCSCKLRKAADGKQCCVKCVASYNARIRQQNRANNATKNAKTGTAPVLINATAKQIE